jgi:soluble lytic murein transglycosylase-like protein
MLKLTALSVTLFVGVVGFSAVPTQAQIASSIEADGRKLFINAEPLTQPSLSSAKRTHIYLQRSGVLSGAPRPAVSVDRDGVEKLVREAADRHHVDPALVRAVIETESNWNPIALSNKGAGGLMQLIPTTARRFGVNDVFNPQQNIDGGVHYLKTLLERYNGNMDLALAAYNAGEGAVDRAHGVPAFAETRSYVQKVQAAYYRPGSGRSGDAFVRHRPIHRDVDTGGRVIFTNE